MKIRLMTVAGLVCMLASTVGAQTKFTATVQCAKPDPNYKVEVGDHPGQADRDGRKCNGPVPRLRRHAPRPQGAVGDVKQHL